MPMFTILLPKDRPTKAAPMSPSTKNIIEVIAMTGGKKYIDNEQPKEKYVPPDTLLISFSLRMLFKGQFRCTIGTWTRMTSIVTPVMVMAQNILAACNWGMPQVRPIW